RLPNRGCHRIGIIPEKVLLHLQQLQFNSRRSCPTAPQYQLPADRPSLAVKETQEKKATQTMERTSVNSLTKQTRQKPKHQLAKRMQQISSILQHCPPLKATIAASMPRLV